jgi:POT family proton-dependent oligopeptide transporter
MARLLQALFNEQPRAFYMIFMLEIWERFGYYTVQGILTLYFIRHLGFSESNAYLTYGAFSALVYGMVAIGGYLGDKVLGTKRTIVLGLIVLAAGYLFLSLVDSEHVFLALGLICVGNGLFKANPSSLLSKCYVKDDSRLHGAFTLYYMAINIGSIFALFIGPTVSSVFGYPYAYMISFVGILLGLANYLFQQQHISTITSSTDLRHIPLWLWTAVIIGVIFAMYIASYLLQHVFLEKKLVYFMIVCVVIVYFHFLSREDVRFRKRMLLAFILMLEAVMFFSLYQQMPTSINLFAVNNVRPSLFGIPINPQSFQALNPIWIVMMSPLLAFGYAKINERGVALPVPFKFALGMGSCALSFLLLYASSFVHDDNGMVSSLWLVASYLFQSIGELLVSALGVAMVAELVPPQISGFVMGMWFLTSSTAGFIGARLASYTALPVNLEPGFASLTIYTHVFLLIGLASLTAALILWLLAPKLTRLMDMPMA